MKSYERLGVEYFMKGNSLITSPLDSDDGLSVEILIDLISQGYSGDQLIEKFALLFLYLTFSSPIVIVLINLPALLF